MTTFKRTFRVESARLRGWDYGTPGMYFVTICTKERLHTLGEVVEGEMYLSDVGVIVQRCWQEIPAHFSHVALDEFVVMPDHLHGIIALGDNLAPPRRDVACNVSTPAMPRMAAIAPASGTLSTVVRSFKAAVTRACRAGGGSEPVWQARFYDHIIRDEESLCDTRLYILQNAPQWQAEHAYVANLWA